MVMTLPPVQVPNTDEMVKYSLGVLSQQRDCAEAISLVTHSPAMHSCAVPPRLHRFHQHTLAALQLGEQVE